MTPDEMDRRFAEIDAESERLFAEINAQLGEILRILKQFDALLNQIPGNLPFPFPIPPVPPRRRA